MWIWLFGLAFLTLWGVSFRKTGDWNQEFLSRESARCIKGLTGFMIVLHHLIQNLMYHYEGAGCMSFVEKMGPLLVGIFFFWSGYGLMHNLRMQGGYLTDFLKKRLISVLLPFYLSNVIFILVTDFSGTSFFSQTGGYHAQFGDYLQRILGIRLVNVHGWYIIAVTLFYLLFYICFKSYHQKKALHIFGTVTVLYMLLALCLGHGEYWFQGEWWYNSCYVMLFGLLIAAYEESVLDYVRKHYTALLIIAVLLFTCFAIANLLTVEEISYYMDFERYGLRAWGGRLLCLAVQIPYTLLFLFVLLLISMKVRFRNRMLLFLGTISPELYLIHNLYVLGFRSEVCYLTNRDCYTAAVLAASILSAVLMHYLNQKLLIRLKVRKRDTEIRPGKLR